jgi:hypothetical protein
VKYPFKHGIQLDFGFALYHPAGQICGAIKFLQKLPGGQGTHEEPCLMDIEPKGHSMHDILPSMMLGADM